MKRGIWLDVLIPVVFFTPFILLWLLHKRTQKKEPFLSSSSSAISLLHSMEEEGEPPLDLPTKVHLPPHPEEKKIEGGTCASVKKVSAPLIHRSKVPPIRTLFKNTSPKKHLIVIAEVMNGYQPKQ